MYKLYKDHCQLLDQSPVSEPLYHRAFNIKFNLHFHSSSKDTCTKCDGFKLIILAPERSEEEKANLKLEHEVHLRKKEAARYSLKTDAIKAKNNQSFYVMTFDLEKALPFPILTTSVAYYKQNIYVYNLGCHEMSCDLDFMYIWDKSLLLVGPKK